MKLVTSLQMRELDRKAIEDFFIPGIVLMENAGQGTVAFMLSELGPVTGKSAVIFCGPGNNGGDGLVIARIIHQLGGFPNIFFLANPKNLTGDAQRNYAIVSRLNLPLETIPETDELPVIAAKILKIHNHAPVWSFVDAIFGTGLKRKLSGKYLAAVELINTISRKLSCPVTAVDIPSGLDSDTGAILGGCTHANLTATYGFAKPGHYHHGGQPVGKIKIIDIGIPLEATQQENIQGELLGSDICHLQKKRTGISHKGNFGHLFILAGSAGKTGAAILSASGALHSGVGLVSLAVPNTLNNIFETSLPEAMTLPLPNSETFFSIDDYEIIVNNIQGKNGIVIGPGIGTNPKTEELIVKLYTEVPIPMIIDADAINIVAKNRKCLAKTSAARIFTPHPGEMARLLTCSTASIQDDRLLAASWANTITESIDHSHELVTVLKGAGTVCCNSNGYWAINSSGNNGMATGGMGDVLSGLIGGLLVQGYTAWESARIGVYLHGLAADMLAERQPWGYLASDVAKMLPFAMNNTFQLK